VTAAAAPHSFGQVHYILNELVMGGMVLETNMSEIIARIEDQNRIEKQEVRSK
jgi:AP-3 complex subunit sigma